VTDHETDPIVQRAVDELRRLPALDHDAVRRITGAAAAARLSPADDPVTMPARSRMRWWITIGAAAAAAVVGFIARDLVPTPAAPTESVRATAATAPTPVVAVGSNNAAVPLVPQQFVLESSSARRVAVVGDFNNWNPNATPMTRPSDGALWSAIVPIAPGRHMYGFIVNDSLFMLDPRSEKARDPDLGSDVSVRMVERP
jgi:hypothetical protein